MNDDQNSQNEAVHPGLMKMRAVSLQASPFLASRVQANLKATATQTPHAWFSWARALSVAGIATVAVFTALLIHSQNKFSGVDSYALNRPYMIKVDVREISVEEVAYAEIELKGESVAFNSAAFEDVGQSKQLTINGDVLRNKQYLPIVVKGIKSGTSSVAVNFYDRDHKLINSRTIDLSFSEGT